MKLVSLLKTVENSVVELRFNPNSNNDFESNYICELEFGKAGKIEEYFPENLEVNYFVHLLICDVVSVVNRYNCLLVFLEDPLNAKV